MAPFGPEHGAFEGLGVEAAVNGGSDLVPPGEGDQGELAAGDACGDGGVSTDGAAFDDGGVPADVGQAVVAEAEFPGEVEARAVNAQRAGGEGDVGEVERGGSAERHGAHDQLPVEHTVAGASPIHFHGHALAFARDGAMGAARVVHGEARGGIEALPEEGGVEGEAVVVGVVGFGLAGKQFGVAGAGAVDDVEARSVEMDLTGGVGGEGLPLAVVLRRGP